MAVDHGPNGTRLLDADGAPREFYRLDLITRSRRIGMASANRDIHDPLGYGRIGLGF
jgi:hypothetical protein